MPGSCQCYPGSPPPQREPVIISPLDYKEQTLIILNHNEQCEDHVLFLNRVIHLLYEIVRKRKKSKNQKA